MREIFGEREKFKASLDWWLPEYNCQNSQNCTLEIHAFYCICNVPQVKHHKKKAESLRPHIIDSSLQEAFQTSAEVRMGTGFNNTLGKAGVPSLPPRKGKSPEVAQ